MKYWKRSLLCGLVVCTLFAFTACSNRNAKNNGIDKEGDGIVDDIGDDLKDGAEDIIDGVGDVGRDIKDGVEDMGRDVRDGVEDIDDDNYNNSVTEGTTNNR